MTSGADWLAELLQDEPESVREDLGKIAKKKAEVAGGSGSLPEPAVVVETKALELYTPPAPLSAEIVPARPSGITRAELKEIELRGIEDDILCETSAIIRDVTRFRDIDPDSEAPPPEWIAEHGADEAKKRFRLAKVGWSPKKDAPVGIEVARSVMVGIVKARATEKKGPSTLNVAFVKMTSPFPQFLEMEVEEK